ncbi:UNVERIFIED_ORG: MoaD family protein [Pseudomonas lini]|uniref:MoaD/ThiS family protein n=1 Tax=Pseudomonas viciae TaxID=2505979 RepID=A0A4P7PHJ4_9PSED|nr:MULTISPECIES: MoaD/ThiS family protein [Pseudomonas]QBZ90159.1 MoaD/ThiS family protein [Pseudomonas viciae]UZE84213.1 MoaD/ThiS family protein [Pseudomonas viciae]WGO91125.1 MoaD/ThiS family protein [Pseudomonas viciae]WHS62803.1 MoaD/ThiS family protein [Pseudomonas sp. G2-4]
MSIFVTVPTLLRTFTQDQKRVEVQGQTVLEVIEDMEKQYPGVKERLIGDGQVHRFVNIYVNDDDIRFADNLATTLKAGDSLTILPAVAGG